MNTVQIIVRVLISFIIISAIQLVLTYIIAKIADKLCKFKLARKCYSMLYLQIPIKSFQYQTEAICHCIQDNCNITDCKCIGCEKYRRKR